MLPRHGRVAHICEANRTVEWNCNKNLGENRKESQLPSKSEGCNEIQGFRGNCDSLGKLGMCPSLAEPNSSGFPRSNVSRETWHESNIEIGLQYTSRRQMKVFRCSSFLKMLPRCGRVAHICEANRTAQWNCNKNLRENRKNCNCLQNQKVVMREQGFRGNCDSQASWGCAPALPNRIWVVSLEAMFHVKHYMTWKQHRNWVAIYEPQANESFLIQHFFKNVGEVQGE